MPKQDRTAKRRAEIESLSAKLADAVAAALAAYPESEQAAWREVATYAGNVQRRARLLAGLGRGG
jgi:hypothetical protein